MLFQKQKIKIKMHFAKKLYIIIFLKRPILQCEKEKGIYLVLSQTAIRPIFLEEIPENPVKPERIEKKEG